MFGWLYPWVWPVRWRWAWVCSMLFCLLTGEARADVTRLPTSARAALVRVNGRCSGVCVSPDGWILSAAHCFDWPKVSSVVIPGTSGYRSIIIQFDGQPESRAELRHLAYFDDHTDLAVLKVVKGQNLPFVPLSKQPPAAGDPAFTLGYPAGKFAFTECRIVSIGLREVKDRDAGIAHGSMFHFECVQTDAYINAGNSGGPLINQRGEVIGIASRAFTADQPGKHAPPGALWASWDSIQQAMQVANAVPAQLDDRSRVYAFLSRTCGPCIEFSRDWGNGQSVFARQCSQFCIPQLVYQGDPNFQALAERYQVTAFPTFVVVQNGQVMGRVEGYQGPQWLAAEIQRQIFPVVSAPPRTGIRDPPPAERSPELPADPPADPPATEQAPPAAPDLAGVEVVVLVAKLNSESAWFDTLLSLAESRLKGAVETRIERMVGGKASVRLVFERVEPLRFEDLAAIAGIDGAGYGSVLVLCQKQVEGIKGALVGKIEAALKGLTSSRLKELPVTVLFERLDSDAEYFAEAREILARDPESMPDHLLTAGAGGGLMAFIGALWARLRGQKARSP